MWLSVLSNNSHRMNSEIFFMDISHIGTFHQTVLQCLQDSHFEFVFRVWEGRNIPVVVQKFSQRRLLDDLMPGGPLVCLPPLQLSLHRWLLLLWNGISPSSRLLVSASPCVLLKRLFQFIAITHAHTHTTNLLSVLVVTDCQSVLSIFATITSRLAVVLCMFKKQ